jgi:hypothetical protein
MPVTGAMLISATSPATGEKMGRPMAAAARRKYVTA